MDEVCLLRYFGIHCSIMPRKPFPHWIMDLSTSSHNSASQSMAAIGSLAFWKSACVYLQIACTILGTCLFGSTFPLYLYKFKMIRIRKNSHLLGVERRARSMSDVDPLGLTWMLDGTTYLFQGEWIQNARKFVKRRWWVWRKSILKSPSNKTTRKLWWAKWLQELGEQSNMAIKTYDYYRVTLQKLQEVLSPKTPQTIN